MPNTPTSIIWMRTGARPSVTERITAGVLKIPQRAAGLRCAEFESSSGSRSSTNPARNGIILAKQKVEVEQSSNVQR